MGLGVWIGNTIWWLEWWEKLPKYPLHISWQPWVQVQWTTTWCLSSWSSVISDRLNPSTTNEEKWRLSKSLILVSLVARWKLEFFQSKVNINVFFDLCPLQVLVHYHHLLANAHVHSILTVVNLYRWWWSSFHQNEYIIKIFTTKTQGL